MPPRDLISLTPGYPLQVEDITRREILKGAFALPLIAAGVSCGDDDHPDATGESASPIATATSVPTTRMVNHALGSTEVPFAPKRVVVADNSPCPTSSNSASSR